MHAIEPTPLRAWLRRIPQHNRLTAADEIWAPLAMVDERIVRPLLSVLGQDGVPGRCTWLGTGRKFFPRHSRWCLWIPDRYSWRAGEILDELVPLLML